MKMKHEPKKPVRKTRQITLDLYDGMSGAELIRSIQEWGCDPSNITLRKDAYVDYGCAVSETFLESTCPETEEEYAKRLAHYDIAMEKYNKWYEKHKDEIEKESAARKEKHLTIRQKQIFAEEKRIEKQLCTLQKDKANLARKKKDAGLGT